MKRGDRGLKFFRRYDDGIVHLRIEQTVTLCGISTAECGDFMTGPVDAADAPRATCPVCVERRAAPDLAAQLLAAAKQVSARRRLWLRH